MRPVQAPDLSAREVYALCISKTLPKVKARLQVLEEDVVKAADEFEAAASTAALHTLAELKTNPSDKADRVQLTKNYTQRLANKNHPAREIYDELKIAGRICPLCAHRDVETLDHQLPKSLYPLLAVVPSNLVPACRSCNTLKSDAAPSGAHDQTLHPYFDDISKEQWLFARVHEVAPACVSFYVKPPSSWDEVLATRVRWHFQMFGLAELYGNQASRAMTSLRYVLKRKAPSTIPAYLKDEADGGADEDLNSWKAVMFQALAGSSWYINGGFALE
jgi:5-methylcytosine-specific restriction endonuclease McrA